MTGLVPGHRTWRCTGATTHGASARGTRREHAVRPVPAIPSEGARRVAVPPSPAAPYPRRRSPRTPGTGPPVRPGTHRAGPGTTDRTPRRRSPRTPRQPPTHTRRRPGTNAPGGAPRSYAHQQAYYPKGGTTSGFAIAALVPGSSGSRARGGVRRGGRSQIQRPPAGPRHGHRRAVRGVASFARAWCSTILGTRLRASCRGTPQPPEHDEGPGPSDRGLRGVPPRGFEPLLPP